MSLLQYTLFQGKTVNRWLISDIREELIRFEPVTLKGDINLWLKEGFSVHENPCKTEFVKSRKRQAISYAHELDNKPDGKISWMDYEGRFKIYYPFSDVNVNRSSFWFVPTYLSMWATTFLQAPNKHQAEFIVKTCGGVSIWVNGAKAADFTPFTRNIEHSHRFKVELEEGLNKIDVFADDLAERDTYFYFRLDCISDAVISQAVPVGDADSEALEKIENAFNHMSLDRYSYSEGEIVLELENPFKDKELKLRIQGAAEENLQSGDTVTREATVPAGGKSVLLGSCSDYPMGFLEIHVSCKVSDIWIERPLTFENYPANRVPPPAKTIAERKEQTIKFLAEYGESNINKAVAMLYADGDKQEIEKIIRKQMKGINARYDCSDFFLVYFPKIWSEFKDRGLLSEGLLNDMKDCMKNFRYWMDEPGDDVMWFYSENHALMFHVCQRLVGELFPDEIFINSGLWGRQMAEKAKGLLLDWFEKFFEEGFTEWNSSAYLPVDALGFGNLYAQTGDEELKALAKRGLDMVYYLLALNSKDGILSCSAGRIYLKELMGNRINSSTGMSYVGYGLGNINQAAKGVLSVCISDYEPTEEYIQYFQPKSGSALLCQSTQGFEKHVDLYTYKTENFLLTTAIDFKYKKYGYQEQVIHCNFDALSQLWINHPGELATHGCARPSYWAGSGCLPRVNQYKGYASIFYDIDESHTVDFTHLFLPKDTFDDVKQIGNWIFVRKGNGFCGVYAHKGLIEQSIGPNKHFEMISKGYKNTWLLRASDISEFNDYNQFVNSIVSAALTVKEDNQSLVFVDPVYGNLSSGMKDVLEADGEKQKYNHFPLKGEIRIS